MCGNTTLRSVHDRARIATYVRNRRGLALLFTLPFLALAETYSGSAHVVDGDTVIVNQTRLPSTDAFERAQNRARDGQEYPCGLEATRALIGLIGQREVRC